jgi:tetratricopeptide (TPR) repeat protein
MAWKGHEPATKTAGTFVQRLSGHAGLILAAVAAVAAVGLAIRPMRSIGLMYQAQRVLTKDRSDEAVGLFLAAAAADPLDPLPLSAAAVLREAGTFDKAHLVDHYQNRVALCQAAIQRNPLDYDCWRSLAIARMFLACEVGDFRLVDASIRDMRRALEMNPRWPKGWLELAQMAAVTDSQGGERVALLQIALAAADRALALEDGRPVGTPPALNAQDRARLLELREQLSGRLNAIGRQSAATQPGR